MSAREPIRHDYAARRTRVRESLRDWGIDTYLVTTPSDLRYLTGFAGTSQLGPNPFTGGPSAGLLATPDATVLCLPQQDVGALPPEDRALETAAYPTFLELSPLYPRRLFEVALLELLKALGVTDGQLGYQAVSLPAGLADAVERAFPRVRRQALDDRIGLLRMRKEASELEAIRRSVALCDAAQGIVAGMAQPGVREDAILAAIRETVERLGGGPLPLIHEVTSGPRSGRIGSSASERQLEERELVLTDIAPQLDGYWGDSCATRATGALDHERARMVRVVTEALAMGTEAVRSGIRASEVDRTMREHVGASLPAYHNAGGHGIGLDYHEPPRLVPAEELPLDEGMVIALEPGVYIPDHAGVRLEHLVLVTADGCDVLSQHLEVQA